LAQYPVFTPKGVSFAPKHYQAKTGIGAPLGYVVADILAQKGWLSPFQNSPEDGLWMVGMNKLDGYAVERLIGTSLLARNNLLNKVEVSDYIVLQTQWHVAFNKVFYKANPTIVHKFWQQVAEHRQILESEYSK
jgi:polar amino acid transport system substrate-binding protein